MINDTSQRDLGEAESFTNTLLNFTAESALKEFFKNQSISREAVGKKVDCIKHHVRRALCRWKMELEI